MNQKNHSLSNLLASDSPRSLPPASRGASHAASHPASQTPLTRRRDSGRRSGLHLVRRNGIFQFRRRWPATLRALGAPAFLSASLRSHVRADAVKRAARPLAAIETGERQVLAILTDGVIGEAKTRALLPEMVRAAVAGMMTGRRGIGR